MHIVIVLALYIWVTLIHCIFVGATLYFFFGKRLERNPFYINALLIALCLAFLETYWIPIAEPLQLQLYTHESTIQNYFDLEDTTNILSILRPQPFHVVLWIVQGLLTNWWMRKQYLKISTNKN